MGLESDIEEVADQIVLDNDNQGFQNVSVISPTLPWDIPVEEVNEKTRPGEQCEDDIMCDQPVPPLDPLASLMPQEFLQLAPPHVPNIQSVASMISPTMPAQTRDQILTAQEELWTDEIRWHLHRMLIKADPALKVVLDPLIATAVVNTGIANSK